MTKYRKNVRYIPLQVGYLPFLVDHLLRTLFLHDVYFEVCLHVVNFLSIHDVYFEGCLHADANFVSTLFWGLFTCCELSFYTRWYLFWGLFTCCELSFYTRCLFWGVFTCCELCSYMISILNILMVHTSFPAQII